MTDSPLFKRAFVRDLNAELIRAGAVRYPSKEAADHAADYVADNIGLADPYANPRGVTKEASLKACEALIASGTHMCKQAGGYREEVTKTAQSTDPVDIANSDAWALLEKAAADTGALIQGGDNPNDQPAASAQNAEAALEANRRPENYANMGERGVGNYERKGQGNVGTEEKHPESPGASDSGSNSVTENTAKHGMDMPPGAAEAAAAPGAPEISPEMLQGIQLGVQLAAEDPEAAAAILGHDVGGGGGGEAMPPEAPPGPPEGGGEPPPKEASLAAIVQKIAAGNTGALIDGGDVPNDMPAAVKGNAQSPGNAEAALEANRRPENYANKGEKGVGRSDMIPSKDENVGREQKHPEAPKATDSGKMNAPLEHVKSAFDQLFEQTAARVVPYLPEKMADNQKVAHVRATMGLDDSAKADYLQNLYLQSGSAKTAAEGVKNHFLAKAAKDEGTCSTCGKSSCECPSHIGKEYPMNKKASVNSISELQAALSRLRA